MDLWTEFEGVTIDSAFALKKLLNSEGRSAFFSTFNAKGESVLIRIIECHFDEDEILARWRGVQTLGHPNFLRIDRFGQFLIEADDITAVYAVFERVDENLGQVLERGRLSAADAGQIGLSLASALDTLHANGFVHGHVEPRNVFAVGESVKLRSDCIRETPEGEAGFEGRRRDVHDLALLLMHVLHGMPYPSYTPRQRTLPAPFEDIVRKGMTGEWGLAEIQEALAPRKAPAVTANAVPKAAPAAEAKTAPAAAVSATQNAQGAVAPKNGSGAGGPASERRPGQEKAAGPELRAELRNEFRSGLRSELRSEARPEFRPDLETEPPASAPSDFTLPRVLPRQERRREPVGDGLSFELLNRLFRFQDPIRRWIAAGVFLVVVVLFGWLVAHLFSGDRAGKATQPAPPARSATAAPSQTKLLSPHASASRPGVQALRRGQVEWRVVAFTYNRQDQAQKRASSLARKHPELQPEVFSPTGRAPWLVTVGGALERDAAYALARKARSLGLPRDTYAQNYTGR